VEAGEETLPDKQILPGRVCKMPQSLISGDNLGMQKRVILKPSLEKALPKLVSIIETIERKIPY
jgi:hypothetical protein